MPIQNPEAWGPLKARYETIQPRKMLALDGGGIRGILTLQILAKLESELAQKYSRDDYRLCEFFDYVGGTSTGASRAADTTTATTSASTCPSPKWQAKPTGFSRGSPANPAPTRNQSWSVTPIRFTTTV